MPEEEEAILMRVGFCYVKIGANQRNYQRVKHIVDKLKEKFFAFVEV